MDHQSGVRNQRLPVFLLGAAFLSSRLFLLSFSQPTSDVLIYAQYAYEFDAAAQEGVPFYELHARRVKEKTEKAQEEGRLVGSLDEYKNVEYPPLALRFMRFPRLWLSEPPGGEELPPAFAAHYLASFRAGIAVVDVAFFVLLVGLVRRWFAMEPPSLKDFGDLAVQRLALYVLATVLLWHLLYDRLDLVLAFVIVLALWLLASRLHYFWSFAVLAVAVNFKVVPVVLAPIWVLGSMSAAEVLSLTRPRGLLVLAGRSCLLLLLIVACFLPFFIWAGKPALGFLTYHQDRGLEIGSVYASVCLALQALGYPVGVEYTYGSINLRSDLAETLVGVAPWLTAGALLAASVLLVAHCHRLAGPLAASSTARTRLAHLYPRTFAGYALLILMLFLLTNKVFSPQYLLWLAPLLALAPFEGRTWRWLFWGFLLVCLLSTVLVPFLFVLDLYDRGSESVPRAFHAPTLRVSVFLIGRNSLFVVLSATVAVALFLRFRRQAT